MQESVTYSQLSFIMSVLVISYQETANRIKKSNQELDWLSFP